MSSAEQALLMTAVLFGLSFAAIFLFWFAEKFRPIRGPKFRPVSTFTPAASRPAAPRAVLVSTGCTRSKAISTG
jgi:hypothetical protein